MCHFGWGCGFPIRCGYKPPAHGLPIRLHDPADKIDAGSDHRYKPVYSRIFPCLAPTTEQRDSVIERHEE